MRLDLLHDACHRDGSSGVRLALCGSRSRRAPDAGSQETPQTLGAGSGQLFRLRMLRVAPRTFLYCCSILLLFFESKTTDWRLSLLPVYLDLRWVEGQAEDLPQRGNSELQTTLA